MPRITFAIPFYSAADYLLRAVESARAQTEPDWVAVVSDNASPAGDQSSRLPGDPRVRYVRNRDNVGMAGNWNLCLDRAETDLVTILHDDDELLPGYAATMLAAADRHPGAAAFFCRARIIGAEGSPVFSFPDAMKRVLSPGVGVLEGEAGLLTLLRGNSIMCPTLCYRRSVLGTRRFRTDIPFVADLAFTTGLLLDGHRLVGLPEVAYAYRRHGSNATAQHTADLTRFAHEAALYDEIATAAAARGWHRAAREARRKRILRLHLLYLAARDLLALRLLPASRKVSAALRLDRAPSVPSTR